jgi:CheY-like chemotaxis protein
MSGSVMPASNASGDNEKIRLLIVDDIPETRENLRKLLFFESDIDVVGAATNGEGDSDGCRVTAGYCVDGYQHAWRRWHHR